MFKIKPILIFILTVSWCGKYHAAEDKEHQIYSIYSDANSSTYHKTDVETSAYTIEHRVKEYGQFRYEIRMDDGVVYGCYGHIDPFGKLRSTHFVADHGGTRILRPFYPSKVYHEPYISEIVEWDNISLPKECQSHEILVRVKPINFKTPADASKFKTPVIQPSKKEMLRNTVRNKPTAVSKSVSSQSNASLGSSKPTLGNKVDNNAAIPQVVTRTKLKPKVVNSVDNSISVSSKSGTVQRLSTAPPIDGQNRQKNVVPNLPSVIRASSQITRGNVKSSTQVGAGLTTGNNRGEGSFAARESKPPTLNTLVLQGTDNKIDPANVSPAKSKTESTVTTSDRGNTVRATISSKAGGEISNIPLKPSVNNAVKKTAKVENKQSIGPQSKNPPGIELTKGSLNAAIKAPISSVNKKQKVSISLGKSGPSFNGIIDGSNLIIKSGKPKMENTPSSKENRGSKITSGLGTETEIVQEDAKELPMLPALVGLPQFQSILDQNSPTFANFPSLGQGFSVTTLGGQPNLNQAKPTEQVLGNRGDTSTSLGGNQPNGGLLYNFASLPTLPPLTIPNLGVNFQNPSTGTRTANAVKTESNENSILPIYNRQKIQEYKQMQTLPTPSSQFARVSAKGNEKTAGAAKISSVSSKVAGLPVPGRFAVTSTITNQDTTFTDSKTPKTPTNTASINVPAAKVVGVPLTKNIGSSINLPPGFSNANPSLQNLQSLNGDIFGKTPSVSNILVGVPQNSVNQEIFKANQPNLGTGSGFALPQNLLPNIPALTNTVGQQPAVAQGIKNIESGKPIAFGQGDNPTTSPFATQQSLNKPENKVQPSASIFATGLNQDSVNRDIFKTNPPSFETGSGFAMPQNLLQNIPTLTNNLGQQPARNKNQVAGVVQGTKNIKTGKPATFGEGNNPTTSVFATKQSLNKPGNKVESSASIFATGLNPNIVAVTTGASGGSSKAQITTQSGIPSFGSVLSTANRGSFDNVVAGALNNQFGDSFSPPQNANINGLILPQSQTQSTIPTSFAPAGYNMIPVPQAQPNNVPADCPCLLMTPDKKQKQIVTTTTQAPTTTPPLQLQQFAQPFFGQLPFGYGIPVIGFIPILFVPYCNGAINSVGNSQIFGFPPALPVPYPCSQCNGPQ